MHVAPGKRLARTGLTHVALLAVAASLCFASASRAKEPPAEDATYAADETGRKIVDLVESYRSVGFSGAVLAARGGEVIAAVGVGSADLEGTEAISPSTLFEIASVTKSFTAAAVMRLVQDGRLSLDDPIANHLPGVPDACRGITVRHLLGHTSGIPGTNSRGSGDDLAVVLPTFLDGGPRYEPGTHWEYWNQGYSLLSEIIARVSGESYTDYCRRAILDPAGMGHTLFTGDEAPIGASVAVGRSAGGPPRSALEHPYGSYGYQYRGMGGLVTSVWDLWRWDRALAGNDLLSDASKEEMFKPGQGSYALGWFVLTNRKGRFMQSHSGGVRGFACDVRRFPLEDAAVFVLCSRDDVPVWRIADAVEGLLFGDATSAEHPPAPLEPGLAAEIAGRFIDERGNILTVHTRDGVTNAAVHWKSGPTTRAILGLSGETKIVFYEWVSSIEVEVVRDEKGAVTGLAIQGVTYHRAPEEARGEPGDK